MFDFVVGELRGDPRSPASPSFGKSNYPPNSIILYSTNKRYTANLRWQKSACKTGGQTNLHSGSCVQFAGWVDVASEDTVSHVLYMYRQTDAFKFELWVILNLSGVDR